MVGISKQHIRNDLRNWVHQYISEKCIIRKPGMPGKKPGSKYSWMFYLRRGLFNHEFLSAVGQLFYFEVNEKIGHTEFQLTGLETAATPMLAGFPLIGRMFNQDINAFVVRKEPKQYGLLNKIEGVPNHKPAMIIDDLCNSTISMKKCYDILIEEHIDIFPYGFSIVNKVIPGIHDSQRDRTDMYLPKSIHVLSLFNLSDFGLYNPSH